MIVSRDAILNVGRLGSASRPAFALLAFVLTICFFPGRVSFADEKPLTQLIPADVGMCLEVHNLADQVRRFQTTPQFARVAEFPPWRKWRREGGREITKLAGDVARYLGVTSEELWDKVLGRQLAVAVWPGEGKPGEDAPAVLLIRAADDETLARVAKGFRDVQARSDKVRWHAASHAGVDYFVGEHPTKKAREFLAVRGDTAVLSQNQRHFEAVLGRFRAEGPEGSLGGLKHYDAARRQIPRTAVVTGFVNPRPWEPRMQAGIDKAPERERPGLRIIFKAWQAVDSCTWSLTLQPRVAMEAVVRYDQDELPEPVAEILGSFGGVSEFLSKTPADCLFALAGRVDVDRLVRLALKLRDPKEKNDPDGAMLVVQVLRLLGPEIGTYVTAGDEGTGNPLHWAVALGVRPGLPRHDLPDAEDLLRTALPVALTAAAKVLSDSAAAQAAGFFGGDGFQLLADGMKASRRATLAFSFVQGHLWAATSPDTMQQAQTVAAGNSLAANPRWTTHLSPTMARPSYALFVNSAGWRRVLKRHAEAIVYATAKKRNVAPQTVRRGMDQLLSLLRLADTLVVAAKIDRGVFAMTVSVAVESKDGRNR